LANLIPILRAQLIDDEVHGTFETSRELNYSAHRKGEASDLPLSDHLLKSI
jgi:hypothetical protein